MQFAEIPGLSDIKKSLVASYKNNHIAHAQLFNSPVGGGGLPMALAFSTFLLCENKQEEDSCGECSNCKKMANMVHPDVHYFYPKPSSTKQTEYDKLYAESLKKWRQFARESPYANIEDWIQYNGIENKNVLISKEDSRQLIKTVSMKSFEGDLKILIIWYPEFMHPAAANGILKVLEEPPTQTIYLLVSYSYDNLLATIRSRTQIFTIPPFREDSIREYLTREREVPEDTASKISRLASGSLGKALDELGNVDAVAYQKFQSWMRVCLSGDYSEMVKLTEQFSQSSKPVQRNEFEYALSLIRESILSKVDTSMVTREGDEAAFITKFGGFASLEILEKIYYAIGESLSHLQRNANAKITFMNLSLVASQLLRSQ